MRFGRTFPIRPKTKPFRLLGNFYNVFFTDQITISDTIIKAPTKTFAETITMSETFTTLKGKVFNDVITITDSIIKTLNGIVVTLWKKVAKEVSSLWTKQERVE